jgi:PAS domain S-box-containing protein
MEDHFSTLLTQDLPRGKMSEPTHILIVEDFAADVELAEREIRKVIKSCEFQHVETRAEYLAALETFQPDLVLSDFHLPHFNGMEALKLVLEHAPLTPLIIWTGSLSEDIAVDCMKAGANNYIIKENMKRLAPAVIHALEERRLLLERKQAAEKYQAIFENSPEGIFQSTPEGRYISVNPAMARIYGYDSPEEMIESITDILHQIYVEPDERSEFTRLMQTKGVIENFEKRNFRRDGSIIWTSTSVRVVRDAGGVILYYEGFLQDITERKQVEEALEGNEKRFRALIENGLDNISLLAADGTLIWESPAVFRTLDYAPDEFLGQNIFKLMHPDDLEWTRNLYANILKEPGGRQRGLFRLRHSSGTWRWVEAIVTNMLDEPHVNAIVVNYRDITERKQAEGRINDLLVFNEKVLNSSPIGILTYKLTGECVFANQNAASIVGASVEKLTTQNFHSIESWKKSGLYQLAEEAITSRIPVTSDIHLVSTFGKDVWLTAYAATFKSKDEDHLLLTMSDITERKQAEIERQALLEIMQGLANTNELHEFLRLIHHSIGRVIYAENFFVVLNDQSSGLFEEIYSVDQYDQPEPPSKLEKSITSYVFRTGEPLLLTQARFDELVTQGEVELVGTNSVSWMGAPLKAQRGIIGVLAVQDYENPNRYTERDKDFLASIASQVALAIERKRAEELLRESEERFSSAFEYASIGIALVAPDGHWLRVNQALCELLGYSEKELLEKTFQDITHPEDLETDLSYVRQVLAGDRRSFQMEKRYFHNLGHVIWVLLSVSLVRDNKGKPQYFIAQIQDITERKRAEASLREEQEKVQNYLDIAGVMLLALDQNGKVTLINQKGCELLGYSFGEIIGRDWVETFLPPAVRNEMKEVFQTLMAGDSQLFGYYENSILTKNGEERVIAWHNTLVRDSHGTVISTLSSGEDITERKRAEDELRASEERFRQLANNIQEVFWMTDAESGKEIYMSPAAEEIWGRSREFLMSEPDAFKKSILPEDLPVVSQALESERKGGKAEIEYRITRPDGSVRWIWDRAFPILDEAGKVKRIAGVSADITERKQTEEQLRKLSHAVEQSASTIVITDAGGSIEYVNPKFTETTGYTFNEAIGQNPRILKSGNTSPEEYKRLWETIKSGEEWRGELYNKKKNGELYWEYATISPIFNERGETTHFIAVKEDITERKRAETRTRRHLAELEALYENGLAVGRLLKPSEIGDRIIETFARHLSWHHVAIRLKRPESDDLELIALNQPGLNEQERAEMERHFNSMIRKVDQGLSGWVIQTGEPIRTGNVHTLPQYVDTQEGIQSGLYMPLKIGDRIIGSISVESEVADAFTSQDERLLATLSNQAAIAFENARLYQSAQQELAERKRLQEQLDHEHAQLKALFETIPDPIWLKDPQGKYLACNPVLEELINIPEAQILGKTDYDLLDKKLAEHFKTKDQEAINRNVPMTYQEWVTYPNKLPQLMETVRTPMHDDRGRLIGVLGISHDITAMHNTQQELRESQELYRLLVETSPDGIGILGLDGTIIFANQQLADMFGMKSPFDCIGTNFLSLVAPDRHPHITNLMGELVPDGISLEEYQMVRKDGSRFDGETRFSLSLDKASQPRWIIGQIRDITESKTARETIQEERQRFLELFENTPVAIWLEDFSAVVAWMEQLRIKGVTDLKEYLTRNPDQLKYGLGLIRILSVNQAAVEMNGAHSKAHLLENFYQLVREEAPSDVMMDELDLLWKGKTSFEFEMTSRTLDDTLSTGILHVYIPVNNGKPDYGRVIIASTDISERVNTEKALQASETHYRELADSITDVFFEMDSDLHYIYWNKSSETLTGIMAKDAIGKSMREIFGETVEQARIEKIYEDVLRNHQPKTFETSLTLGSHQYVFEINAYPSTRGVSVVAKDVTDRKRSETIMQKRFELMEYSAHHSLNEVMQKTIDEVSQLTGSSIGFLHFVEADEITLGMQTWSTSTLQQFSVPVSEGTHLPVDRAGVWADAVRKRRPMIQNDYYSLPNKKRLPEGHAQIFREMVIPIIRNEKTVAVLGLGNRPADYTQRDLEIAGRFADYAWDITERKQMEIALADERNQLAKRVEERAADLIRANTNLARALRVKDEFLANMSHELRTPLNAILGLSESLGEQIAGPLNEKQQKYIVTISESGRHLLSLINDILDLAKIEAGQITLDINRVDIQSVCEASLRMIKQLAQNKRQDVRLEIDDEIGLIWADERRLKQMIVNLLSNAVKFTPEDGKIGLEVHGNLNENEVMITVWDNGIGMKEEDLSRLFQPFVQLDSGLARETTGTGLGLALVAQMVRLHGGSVRVNSHPEQGSRFTIVLPWEPALAIDPASKMKVTGKFRAVMPDSKNKPTILLIEDTNEVIMMIRDYLELAGYQVVTARDGVEGITQAQLIHPDLILMDVMMPRMDGLEATRRLRSETEFEATPIIALTALAMPTDRERCISAGMNDYMSKPVNLKELVKTIQRFLVNPEETSS